MTRIIKPFLLISLVLVLAFAVIACDEEEPSATDTVIPIETDTTPSVSVCEHQWSSANCTTPKTCNLCGATEGSVADHSTTAAGDRTATCETPAYCSVCQQEYGEALGHSVGAEGDLAATCTNKAYCSICESEYGSLGHDMQSATCLLPAGCKLCGVVEGKALGHDFSGALESDDSGHWSICLNGCGNTNKTEHQWSDWELGTSQKTKYCICGHSVTVAILTSTPEPAPECTTQETPGADVTLVSNSVAQYFIISKNSAYNTIAENLATLLTSKTGVVFTYREIEPTTGNKIYVGYNPNNLMYDSDRLTYSGYVLRLSGENLHISGHSKSSVQAAANALADMAGNSQNWTVNGSLRTITIPASAIKTYNPESYPNRDANLLGKHISNYIIVLPKNYSVNERFAAEALIDQIGQETGYKLEYIAENITNNKTCRIVLGKTALAYSATIYEGLQTGSYRIRSNGECVYIAYDNYLVAGDACDKLCELYKTDPISAINESGYPDYSQSLVQKKDASHIRIMTTNIVSPADSGGQEMEVKYDITWKNRIQIQGEMIMTYLPDFIGFQELQQGKANGVTAAAQTEMLKTIGDEYAMVSYEGLPKSDQWTPIAYRKTVWQVEDQAYGIFHESANPWQWALFSMIDDPDTEADESEIKYIVMNLHYPITKYPDRRALAGPAVNAEYKRLKTLYPEVPISIVGDFNAEYNSELFNATIAGTDLKTGYMATSDYGTSSAAGIDHVLVENSSVTVHDYRVINDGVIYMSSDHRPVFVDLTIGKIDLPNPGPDISWDDGEILKP